MCTTSELLSGFSSKWCLCYSNICQFQIILQGQDESLLSVGQHWGIFQPLSLLSPSFLQKHPHLFEELSWTVISLRAPLHYKIKFSFHCMSSGSFWNFCLCLSIVFSTFLKNSKIFLVSDIRWTTYHLCKILPVYLKIFSPYFHRKDLPHSYISL